MHYKVDYADDFETWKDIDCTWRDGRITAAPYTAEIDGLTLRVIDKRTGKTSTISLESIGGESVTGSSAFILNGRVARISDFALDADLEIVAGPKSISFRRVLKSDKAHLDASFKIEGDIPVVYQARDADGEPLHVTVLDLGGNLKSETILAADLKGLDGAPVRYPLCIDPTLTVQPSALDTYIYEGSPTSHYGTAIFLRMQSYTDYVMRVLLEFDISAVPAWAIPSSATLSLYYYYDNFANAAGETVWAYKLTNTDWNEFNTTWNVYKTANNWTAAGGDYVTVAPPGASTVFPGAVNAWMNWDVLDIIEDAIGNSDPAEFLIRFDDETYAVADRVLTGWYSNNYVVDTDLCPKLVIDYPLNPDLPWLPPRATMMMSG